MFVAVNGSTGRYYARKNLETPTLGKAKRFKTFEEAREEVPKFYQIRTIQQELGISEH